MIVKVLVDENGKYLKDYALEKIFNYFPYSSQTLVMGYWVTDDPKEAMHFWTSMDAIVTRHWLPTFEYKNVEIDKLYVKHD